MSRSFSVGIGAALASTVTWSMCDLTSWSMRVELGGLEQRRLDHPLAEDLQGIHRRPQLGHLVGAAIGHGIALEMPEVAVELDVDQAGAAALAGALDHLAGHLVDGEEVVAVDLDGRACRSPRRGRAGCRRPTSRWPSIRRSHCPRPRRSPAGSRPWRDCSSRRSSPGWSRRRRRRRSRRRRSSASWR